MKDIRIAIDGPASSGKSTVAKIIAKNLGYTYLDTGAMYRSATYLALQNGLTEENVPEILEQLSQHPISFGKAADGSQQVYVGDVDITHPIRDNQVTNNVSWVAAIPEVRQELVAQQQRIAQQLPHTRPPKQFNTAHPTHINRPNHHIEKGQNQRQTDKNNQGG